MTRPSGVNIVGLKYIRYHISVVNRGHGTWRIVTGEVRTELTANVDLLRPVKQQKCLAFRYLHEWEASRFM